MNTYKKGVAIVGSEEAARCSIELLEKAEQLGALLAQQKVPVLTGGGYGFAYFVARGAYKAGGVVVALSPAATRTEHCETYGFPEEYFTTIIYTGLGLVGRDLLLARSSERAVVAGEGVEFQHEFAVALSDNHVVSILEGAHPEEHRSYLSKSLTTHTKVYSAKDPVRVVTQLLQ